MPMAIDQTFVIYALCALAAVLFFWIGYLEVRIRRLSSGKSGKSLEHIICNTAEKTQAHGEHIDKVFEHIGNLDTRISKGLQGYGVERFNAYGESGGNQSFSVCMVNEHGDGMVLSSLYTRDRVSLYVKPLENFASQTELTPEEKKALGDAKGRIGS